MLRLYIFLKEYHRGVVLPCFLQDSARFFLSRFCRLLLYYSFQSASVLRTLCRLDTLQPQEVSSHLRALRFVQWGCRTSIWALSVPVAAAPSWSHGFFLRGLQPLLTKPLYFWIFHKPQVLSIIKVFLFSSPKARCEGTCCWALSQDPISISSSPLPPVGLSSSDSLRVLMSSGPYHRASCAKSFTFWFLRSTELYTLWGKPYSSKWKPSFRKHCFCFVF